MRVTTQWIILGWLILFVNKKECSQTSCKSSSFVFAALLFNIDMEKLFPLEVRSH